MKKVLVLLAFATNLVCAQNLVSNPSFEKCDKCNPWVEFFLLNNANNPVDWFGVTGGSSDIRNEFPRTGKRNGGFFSFGKYEYLGNVLNSPLEAGAEYKFSFWLSGNSKSSYVLDEIGVYFHTGLPQYSSATYLEKFFKPNLVTPDGQYLKPETYQQYEFKYTACGGEDHIIIGRFSPLGLNDTLFVGATRSGPAYPYTFIDDVELIKTKDAVQLLDDQLLLCEGESKKIGIPNVFSDITWSNGSKGDSITISSNDKKVLVEVKYSNACPSIKDSILIIEKPSELDPTDLFLDKQICFSKDTLIDLTNDKYNKYLWEDGSSNPIRQISKVGKYTIKASKLCNYSLDTIEFISGFDFNKFIQVPNVFTPGALDNTTFKPVFDKNLLGMLNKYQFKIFNRWGKMVFNTDDFQKVWQVDLNTPADTYFYTIEYEVNNCKPESKFIKGSVNLIR